MSTTTFETGRERSMQQEVTQPRWQRIALLSIIGYEALGCLSGGALLVAAPDGRLMDMPVDIMHGVFRDFLIPGILLIGLGIINAIAFFSVLRRKPNDWIMAGLALGGLYIWFVVEITILRGFHWLHLMWGAPVLLGIVIGIPLYVKRHDEAAMRKGLLVCGMLSSLWYIGVNIFVPMLYDGYSVMSLTVSEMSAFGAPTRVVWVLLAMWYTLFFAAFGWGVWMMADRIPKLRIVGIMIILYCIFNLYWPPMHQREVLAAGGGTISDSLHIAWAGITMTFMMLLMGFGAAVLDKWFRRLTLATFGVFILFGILTWLESPGIESNLPTPHIGLWERINIGAFMIWVIVFANALLRKNAEASRVEKLLL